MSQGIQYGGDGRVYECNREGPWGVIETSDQLAVWFNEDSFLDGDVPLAVGDPVTFDLVPQGNQLVAVNVRRRPAVPISGPDSIEDLTGKASEPAGATPSETGVEDPGVVHAGEVKWFDRRKGFGYLQRATDEATFFVHRNGIEGEGFRDLVVGEPVEFSVIYDEPKERYKAVSVKSPSHRRRGTVKSFDDSRGFGHIQPEDGGRAIFFHFSDILGRTKNHRVTAVEGELVEYEAGKGEDGRPRALLVKRLDSRPPLLQFASMGNEERWLEALAQRAEPENWSYQHSVNPCSRPILRSYLIYTFSRVQEESDNVTDTEDKKIQSGSADGRDHACFSTGLVTPNQEQIPAC